MSTYVISFRVANQTVGGKTYEQRRDSIKENVRTDGLGFWDETTSFMLVESTLDTPSVTKTASGLHAEYDSLLVFDPEDMSAAFFGTLKARSVLASFFGSFQKVD